MFFKKDFNQQVKRKKYLYIAMHTTFSPIRKRQMCLTPVHIVSCCKVSSVKSVPFSLLLFIIFGRNPRKSLYLPPSKHYLENKRSREVCHKFNLYFGSCRTFSRCGLKYICVYLFLCHMDQLHFTF